VNRTGESRAPKEAPRRFLAALASLGFALRSANDARGVLAAVPEHLIRLTLADRGAVLLHDPDSGELGGVRFEAGPEVRTTPCRVAPHTETFLGRVLRRETLTVEYPEGENLEGDRELAGTSARTMVGVPLAAGTSLLGVVMLAYERRISMEDQSRRALLLVSGQIALALDRARIYEELESSRRSQQESRAAVRKMEESRADLVSIVSHELRTPLTAIKAYTETLIDNVGSPSFTMQEKFLGIINEECDRLTRMVNDVLDLSRMDSGKRRLRAESVSLARLVEDVLPTMAPELQSKRLHVMLDLEHDLPRVEVDPDLLKQVLVNLIGNAAKFSRPDADVTVRAGRIPPEVGSDRWYLAIEDQGMGIPPEKLERVFERFYRVEDSGAERVVGTGLGLAIVKSAVELHGGTIRAESEVGRGSRFVVELPLHQQGFRNLMLTLAPFFERPDLRVVLQSCVEMVAEVMEAGIVSFMFFDDEGAELHIQAAHGLDPDTVARTRVKVGDSIAGWVARTSENLLVEDVESDRRFRKMNHPQYETRSLLCVPLRVSGETVGVVNASNRTTGSPFDADDLSLLAAIATRVGLSLERVRAMDAPADAGALLAAVRAVVRMRRLGSIPGSRRTIRLAVELGRRLGLSNEDIEVLAYVVRVHDVGMLSVGDDLLTSTRRWTDGEHRRVELHPQAGVQLLRPMEFAARVNAIILAHHEHFDGGGYPRGIRGDEIPLPARIVGVLDAFESMTQGRPYRSPMDERDALAELQRCAGTQFDPQVVDHLARLLSERHVGQGADGRASASEWDRDAVR
jgi:signal transduction histidine kinase/putative methionine-R-sulfoxide reductase with GAF domain